jgi:hypothetical protein
MDEKALNEKAAQEELLPVRVRMALEDRKPVCAVRSQKSCLLEDHFDRCFISG